MGTVGKMKQSYTFSSGEQLVRGPSIVLEKILRDPTNVIFGI